MFLDRVSMSFKYFNYPLCILLLFSLFSCKSSQVAKLDFSDGSYEGMVNRSGQKNGPGIYRWSDGSIYEGDYLDDLRHGKGRFLWANGESYEGDYLNDERTGSGVYHWPDGSFYKGVFLAGKRHGKGTYQSANGNIYTGEWFDDLQHGQGTLSNLDGTKVQGIWRKGALVSQPSNIPPTSVQPALPKVQLDQIPDPEPVSDLPMQPEIPPVSVQQTLHNVQLEGIPAPEPVSDLPKQPEIAKMTFKQPVATLHSPAVVKNRSATEVNEEIQSIESLVNDTPTNKETPPTPKTVPSQSEDKTENKDLSSLSQSVTIEKPDWSGTVAEAEREFTTDLINGIDTVRSRSGGIPFTGRMQIVDTQGRVQGEVNLVQGRLHGAEIFYDRSGEIVEKNLWSNGRKIGN